VSVIVVQAAVGYVSAASADDSPATTAPPERPTRDRPGTLPPAAAPAEPVPSVPDHTG
jgi:hypothetical protein